MASAMKMSIPKNARAVGSIQQTVSYPNGEKSHFITWKTGNLRNSSESVVSENFTIDDDDGITLSWCLALVNSYTIGSCYHFFPCFVPGNHCKEAFVKIELILKDTRHFNQYAASFDEICKFNASDENTSVNLRIINVEGLSDVSACCKIIPSSLPKFSVSKDLGYVFENQNFTDVKLFSNDGKVFEAHKLILTARSSVFAAMFTHQMKENEQHTVEIADMDGEVVEDMLRYIYTDKSEKLRLLTKDLFVAADKYDLKGLKKMSEHVLITDLSCSNAVEILLFSELHNATRLKTEVIKFITTKENFEVFNTEAWKSLKPTSLHVEICEAFANR